MSEAAKSIALLSFLGAMLLYRTSNADEAALQGIFVNAAQSEEPIKQAIDQAVKDFNFITRPIARSRLKKTNSILKRVEIGRNGKLVTIALGSGQSTSTEPGRLPVKWVRDDGEVFNVSTAWHDNALVQTFVAPDGQRENRYTLSPDGNTLTLNVILSSPQLKVPLQYQLFFKREGK